MDGKKDPGKFTVRFNIADPQQRAAAEMLNRQGRCKAQFITNAVLFYTGVTPNGQAFFSSAEVVPQHTTIVAATEAGQDSISVSDADTHIKGYDMDSIRRTMEAFQAK